MAVAAPAILDQCATPVAYGFMTAVMSPFGDAAVAANAIMTRLAPVAFGAVFALTGAVGPIFGQNLGARLMDRVRQTLTNGFIFSMLCVVTAWAILFVCATPSSPCSPQPEKQQNCQVLLHCGGGKLDLPRCALCREFSLQQSRRAAVGHGLQLGESDNRHDPIRHGWRADGWREGRACRPGGRRGAVRHRLDGCGLLGGGKAYAKSAAGWTFILNARQFPLLPGMLSSTPRAQPGEVFRCSTCSS